MTRQPSTGWSFRSIEPTRSIRRPPVEGRPCGWLPELILQNKGSHVYLCQSFLEFTDLALFSGHWWAAGLLELPVIRELAHYGRVFSDGALAHLSHLSKRFPLCRGRRLVTSRKRHHEHAQTTRRLGESAEACISGGKTRTICDFLLSLGFIVCLSLP